MNISGFEEIVNLILSTHGEISSKWIEQTSYDVLNLKTTKICDIHKGQGYFDINFLKLVEEYHLEVMLASARINFESHSNGEWEVRSRVKQKESIINKLFHYTDKDDQKGTFPINKCLNDIFGVRVVIRNLDIEDTEFVEICKKITLVKGVRFYYNNKNGYKAIHFYFNNANNHFFPWELQVWAFENARQNEFLHSTHKQKRKYIEWPKEYNDSIKNEERTI